MSLLISICGILVTIFFVIGTHEAAHFIAARLLGVKVIRFSIGFGRSLFRWHDKKGTEYVIAAIPLGGYVKMLDESEGKVESVDLPFAYNRQPFYKKFLIVLAGPFSNIFCAFLLYWLIFTMGFVSIKPLIGVITPHSIASEAGLKPNQEIVSLDNQTTSSWTAIFFRLMAHIGNQDRLSIQTAALNDQKITSHLLDLSTWQMNELNPNPLTSLGIIPYEPPIPLIIGRIEPHSPAAASLLKVGDKIIAFNKVKIKHWQDIMTLVHDHPNQLMIISVEREGKILKIPTHIGSQHNFLFKQHGLLGIAPDFQWPKELLHNVQYPPIAALSKAFHEVINFIYFNLVLFEKMLTGKLSLQSLGGPITIFETAGDALNSGFLAFIGFLAFLSISIGVINLLPIPGLDGGHLFIQTIEFIIQRSIPESYLLIFYRLGFIFILFVLIQALTNDILRLF